MFEEIDKIKVSLPKSDKVVNNIQKHKFNSYQIITFIIGGICFEVSKCRITNKN